MIIVAIVGVANVIGRLIQARWRRKTNEARKKPKDEGEPTKPEPGKEGEKPRTRTVVEQLTHFGYWEPRPKKTD